MASVEGSIIPLYIDGKDYTPHEHSTFPIISAATGNTIHRAVTATPAEAILAVESSLKAFASWRYTTLAHRRKLLLSVAGALRRNVNDIAAAQLAETSCPQQFATYNTILAVEYLEEVAAATSELKGVVCQRPTARDGTEVEGLTMTVTEPIGPVLIIPPWNGAVILCVRGLATAIAAGCTIVLKASEKCPKTHRAVVKAFEEGGVPAGVINVIQTQRQDAAAVTEALVAHKAIRKVEFIGSQAVGRIIGSLCGQYLKPILMELGGKGPAIVLDDANLEKAATQCAIGATLHHGQLCFSTERVIVQRSIYDKFVPLLKIAMERMPGAGVAVDEASAKHAHEVLVDAQQHGATFLVGGPEYAGTNSLVPTLVNDVTAESRIWDEETFGPSATVYVVDTDEEAIAKANDSAYGLSAAVHSMNWERAYRVSRQLEYGQIAVNQMTVGDTPTQPIQGVKGSGWGQNNGIWGIKEFTVEKVINMAPGNAPFALGA